MIKALCDRVYRLESELAALREELATLRESYESMRDRKNSIVDLQQRLAAAEQRNEELVELLREVQKAARKQAWTQGYPALFERVDAALLANHTEEPLGVAERQPDAWIIQWKSSIPGITGFREVVLVKPILDPEAATVIPLYTSPPATVAVTPSLWYIRVPDEPDDPESPCEYFYANSTFQRDILLKKKNAEIAIEYACLDRVKEMNE